MKTLSVISSLFIVSFLLFGFACNKQAHKANIDCGGCGLKRSGKKYENIKKNEKHRKVRKA
jgi:hypothetical protein